MGASYARFALGRIDAELRHRHAPAMFSARNVFARRVWR